MMNQPLRPTAIRVHDKWQRAAGLGWQPVPNLLLKHQASLGLAPLDVVVLLNVLSFWWYVDQKPFPRTTTIARRMQVTPRTVQRSLQKMTSLGLLARATQVVNGEEVEAIDPAGLVFKLAQLAEQEPKLVPDLQEASDDVGQRA